MPKLEAVLAKDGTLQAQQKNIKVGLDSALIESRNAALEVASGKLDTWIAGLMKRVDDPENDNDFLDWYFGYWTQQQFGLDAITTWGTRVFNKKSSTVKEKIQEIVLQKFTNKVFRPEIAKLELKAISGDIAQIYTDELRKNFENARIRYNIPAKEWDSYLQDLATTVTKIDGRQFPLENKAVGVGMVGGSVLVAKVAVPAIEKMTAVIGAKVAAKAAASISAKVGSFSGGSLMPALQILFIAWDAVDIHNTEVKNRPELKQNIEDYFGGMKRDILADRENGIQKVILDIENGVRKGMSTSRFPFLNF